ncbi:uncharacterized protein TNCV_4170751 [Trichonephila clavipes]|nr:uncharacterized protein TNCV_4170751 [Trichonephila clavipes]
MGKKGDISPCKKTEVMALVNAKLFSNHEISRRLKVSEASVPRIKKNIESGEELSPKRKKKCDRKPIFTPRSASVMKAHLNISRTKLSLCVLVVEKSFILTALFRLNHPTKIMIWSVISGKGTGRLDVVKGMMRQDQYKDVLQNRLIPQLKEWFSNGGPYFLCKMELPAIQLDLLKLFGRTKYPSVELAG